MATRNFVPRANGEGKIGTPAKHWGDVYADALHGNLSGTALTATDATNAMNDVNGVRIDTTYIKKDSDYLGYRQPSTAQSVGDIRYHTALPAGWYLECTTAGTTGSGTLTITTPTVGGTVSDGTVTWTIRKNASTQDLTGYLPLSGGQMTGKIIRRNTDNSSLELWGASDWSKGALISLQGKDDPDGGGWKIVGYANSLLQGNINGTLTWNNNSLDKAAVVAESLGTNGYRKYASGLIEQWGLASWESDAWQSKTITFPISFNSANSYRVVTNIVVPDVSRVVYTGYDNVSASTIEIYKSTATQQAVSWIAIGY